MLLRCRCVSRVIPNGSRGKRMRHKVEPFGPKYSFLLIFHHPIMSTHPIHNGGYDLANYPNTETLIAEHRANIDPEARKLVAISHPHLHQARQAHNDRRYSQEKPATFASLVDALPAEVLDQREQALLLNTDASTLLEKLRTGEISAERIVQAALARTQIAQEVLGCCSEIPATLALQRARELDAKRLRNEPLGALHGLPISIKGHIPLVGTTSCRGFVVDCLSPASVAALPRTDVATEALLEKVGVYVPNETAPLAQALLNAGAVVIGKTTMPQTIMHLDTRNNLYGQTLNPCNLALSPGGSSGGESALIASGASLLGVGTDIGVCCCVLLE